MDINTLPEAHYGEPGPLRDRLVAAVLNGEKTGTSALALEYQAAGESLPKVGDREAVIDSDGKRVCITEVTSVELPPLGEIDLSHAHDEGEGFATVENWRKSHIQFWTSDYFKEALGEHYQEPTEETLVVYTRFKVVEKN